MDLVQISISAISSIAVVLSVIYLAKQIKTASAIHQENHEWNRRIETKHALDSYNRLEAVVTLNEEFSFMSQKHPIGVIEINEKLAKDHTLKVHLMRLLNFYEGLANGIDMGLYEELVIKEARRGSMIRTFTAFKDFIEYHKKEINPMAFVKYEALTNKWEKEGKQGIKLHKLGKVQAIKTDGKYVCEILKIS